MIKLRELLQENSHDLATFFAQDPRAGKVTSVIERVIGRLEKNHDILAGESRRVLDHLAFMNRVLLEQQSHTDGQKLLVPAELNEVVENSLHMADFAIEQDHIRLSVNLEDVLPRVMINRAKMSRVLLYLFRNACEAMNQTSETGHIQVRTLRGSHQIILEIEDNGEGIPEKSRLEVFHHGFTTRDGHNGFGLHYCANALKEMGGEISINDASSGQGCLVRIVLRPEI